MKKLISVLLVLMLILAISIPAMAASGVNSDSGTITIDNAVVGQKYTIYQILKLESYDTDTNAYAYKATEAWDSFINDPDIQNVYLITDDNGYVTWKTGAQAADFAKKAQAFAATLESNQGSQVAALTSESTASTTATVTFTGLNLGYYLVDSTLGTLCSLDTTNPSVTMKEKSGVPTLDKLVEEDSTATFGKENDADIGQDVKYKSTITAQPGAENYVFHDKMSTGLTFKQVDSITLTRNNTPATVAESNYKVTTGSSITDGCTFEIAFTRDFCDSLTANDKIEICYTATVNDDAVIGLDGNANQCTLTYGPTDHVSTTPASETKTYTWQMKVLKYANGDKNKKLAGAKFVLLNEEKDKVAKIVSGKISEWVAVPPVGSDGKIPWVEECFVTTDENGDITINGIDQDTYYLREVEPPLGFNMLADDVEVSIPGKTVVDGKPTYKVYTAEVNNQSGTELPETGGIGTTIFYVVGGLLVLVAIVLLVTRKKMSSNKD